jgi:hypothetical protein
VVNRNDTPSDPPIRTITAERQMRKKSLHHRHSCMASAPPPGAPRPLVIDGEGGWHRGARGGVHECVCVYVPSASLDKTAAPSSPSRVARSPDEAAWPVGAGPAAVAAAAAATTTAATTTTAAAHRAHTARCRDGGSHLSRKMHEQTDTAYTELAYSASRRPPPNHPTAHPPPPSLDPRRQLGDRPRRHRRLHQLDVELLAVEGHVVELVERGQGVGGAGKDDVRGALAPAAGGRGRGGRLGG